MEFFKLELEMFESHTSSFSKALPKKLLLPLTNLKSQKKFAVSKFPCLGGWY